MLLSLCQIFIFLLGHLHFFLHFFFSFMENLFKKHPIQCTCTCHHRMQQDLLQAMRKGRTKGRTRRDTRLKSRKGRTSGRTRTRGKKNDKILSNPIGMFMYRELKISILPPLSFFFSFFSFFRVFLAGNTRWLLFQIRPPMFDLFRLRKMSSYFEPITHL